VKIFDFKGARSLISTLFVREARALLCSGSLKFGSVGTFDREDRQLFSDLRQISTVLEHGFNVRAS
jgi:hypothetical protein